MPEPGEVPKIVSALGEAPPLLAPHQELTPDQLAVMEVNPLVTTDLPAGARSRNAPIPIIKPLSAREVHREIISDLYAAGISRASLLGHSLLGIGGTVSRWLGELCLFNFALQAATDREPVKAVVFAALWAAGSGISSMADRMWRYRVDVHERAYGRRIDQRLVQRLGHSTFTELDSADFQGQVEVQRERREELAKVVELAVEVPSDLTKLALGAGALMLLDWRYALILAAANLPSFILRDRHKRGDLQLDTEQGPVKKIHEQVSDEAYSPSGSVRLVLNQLGAKFSASLNTFQDLLDGQKGALERKQALQSLVADASYYGALFGGFSMLIWQSYAGKIEIGMLAFLSYQLLELSLDLDQHGDTIVENLDSARKLSEFYGLISRDENGIGADFPESSKLEFRDVRFMRGGLPNQFTVSLPDMTLTPGDMVLFKGSNGAGKSTILKSIAFRALPTAGQATLGGIDISAIRAGAWSDEVKYCGTVPSLLNGLTVRDALSLDEPDAETLDRRLNHPLLANLIKSLGEGGLDTRIGFGIQDGRDFSTGELKRLELVMTLVAKRTPKIVLLDEAAANLGDLGTEIFESEIARLRSEGAIVIVASHVNTKRFDESATYLLMVSGGQATMLPRENELQAAGGSAS